jgi:hypothetical protein
MKASELSKKFLIWFQGEYPTAKIYRNNRGIAKIGKRFIRFGIPTPTGQGKKEKLKGSDYISFHPISVIENFDDDDWINICISKFWEIKTKTDVLAEGQINFLNMMTEMGAECFVVHEFVKNKNVDIDIEFPNGFWLEKWSVK